MSTEILTIDEVTSAQADKFLTHNEALRQIEGQTIRVLSRTNSGPPVSPSNGDTYIVDVASGVWASATVLDIAHYYGAAWNFYTPVQGMRLHVNDENKVVLFDGVDWDSELMVSGAALTQGSVTFVDSSGNLTEDNANLFWDDSNNRLGIGTASPGVELDVAGGSIRASRADATPTGTANTVFDDMIAGSTDTANTGLTLFGSGQVGIAFGDAADNDIGQIRYQHSSNTMQFITNTTEALNFDSAQLATFSGIISVDDTTQSTSTTTGSIHTDGGLGVAKDVITGGLISTGGEASPDVDAGGICINHGANDGNALTLKNSDVAHGMTTLAETDTYATLSKVLAADGGLSIKGFAEAKIGIKIESLVTTVNTSNTADGGMILNTGLKSGTTVTTLANGDNLLSVDNNDVVKVVVKGNGDVVTAGTFFAAAGVDVSAGGVITNGTIQTYNAAGPALLNEAALSANPTLVPNVADTNTGIGWPSADNLSVVCGGTEAAIFDSSLDLSLPNGGIKLGGGTDLLDTYEEGTWTPELWDATLATDPTPPTYAIQVGTYTRVGDMVHIQGQIVISSLGGLTAGDQISIGALPFTSENVSSSRSGISVHAATSLNLPAANTSIAGRILENTTYVDLQLWDATGGTTSLLVSEFGASGDIVFSATYKV